MESQKREQVEVKPTWRLAWGLFWRTFLIGLAFYGVLFLIIFLITMAIGIMLFPY